MRLALASRLAARASRPARGPAGASSLVAPAGLAGVSGLAGRRTLSSSPAQPALWADRSAASLVEPRRDDRSAALEDHSPLDRVAADGAVDPRQMPSSPAYASSWADTIDRSASSMVEARPDDSFAASEDISPLDSEAANSGVDPPEFALEESLVSPATPDLVTSGQAVLEPSVALGFAPPDLALRAVEQLHGLGLPWWAAIASGTLMVRIALLPLALRTTAMQAKMQTIKKELAQLQAKAQAQARSGMEPTAMKEMQALYEQHGVSPLRMLAMPFLQMPIFLTFFLGLRRLGSAFPDAEHGGVAWFVNLGATDSTYVLPVLSSASALALVTLAIPDPPVGTPKAELEMHSRMRFMMGGITLVSLPVACSMPASVLVFWVTNNVFSLTYSTAVLFPATRAALGLPPLPTASATPSTDPEESNDMVGTTSVRHAQEQAATSLSMLADIMLANGKLEDAVMMHKRAHALTVEAEGEVHPSSLSRLRRLAEVAESAGFHDEAIDALRRWKAHTHNSVGAKSGEMSDRGSEMLMVDEKLTALEMLRDQKRACGQVDQTDR